MLVDWQAVAAQLRILFFDRDTTGQSDTGRGGGRSEPTAEMMQRRTFTDVGWDFDNI